MNLADKSTIKAILAEMKGGMIQVSLVTSAASAEVIKGNIERVEDDFVEIKESSRTLIVPFTGIAYIVTASVK